VVLAVRNRSFLSAGSSAVNLASARFAGTYKAAARL
jgi:hypothetical protein